jgi:hypothetical protein
MATMVERPPDGVQLIYYPIDDDANGSPVFDEVRALARSVSKRRVLSICHMGENRSGLLSALILVERGMTPQGAVTAVQQLGPLNSPDQTTSFWNPGFVRQVLSLSSNAPA